MPLREAAASGAFSSTSTWVGGVIPATGDHIDINGFHVTLADARTVGRSGAVSQIDVLIRGGGSLTVQNGGTLRCRGTLSANGGVYRVEGGGTHLYDATQSASPSTTNYEIRWDSEGAGTRVEFIGTSDALRAVCESDVTGGAARGRMNGQTGLAVFHLTMQWARVRQHDTINCGGYAGRRLHLIDTIIESTVGRLTFGGNADSDVLIDRAIVENNGDRFEVNGGPTRNAGKEYIVRNSTILPEFWTDVGALQVTDTTFNEVFCSDDAQFCSVWERNVLLRQWENGGGGMVMLSAPNNGVLGRTFLMHPSTTSTNPHYIGIRASPAPRTQRHRRWIIESASPDSAAGDIFFAPTGAGYKTIYEQCITLPNPADEPPGCLVNKGHATLNQALVELHHCTIYTDGTLSGLYLDESGTNAADSVPVVQNNLAWSRTSRAGSIVWREPGSTATSGVGSTWGHNAFWNVTNVTSPENPKLGYNGGTAGALVSGTLSGLTTDLDSVNPQFVDDARNLAKFGRDVGGYSGTDAAVRAAVIAALRARPNPADSNYNAAVSIGALLDYIEAGFAPTNPALDSASDAIAGGWRGAVEGVVPGVQLTPDSTISNTSWTAVGAATLHAALAAGDSDAITSSTNGAVATVSLTDPVPNLTALTSVVVMLRHRVT